MKQRPTSREDLLSAFDELVAEFGYDGASLALVAERVGVVKGTIVHHFGTKDRMLIESHLLYMGRRMAEARAILANLVDPAEQLIAMIYSNIRAHRDDRTATVSFLREFTRFASHAHGAEVLNIRREYAAITTSILRNGVESGTFRDIDVDLTSKQIFGAQNHMWTWYRPSGSATPEQIAAEFSRNILRGVRAAGRPGTTDDDVTRIWAPVGTALGEPTLDVQ